MSRATLRPGQRLLAIVAVALLLLASALAVLRTGEDSSREDGTVVPASGVLPSAQPSASAADEALGVQTTGALTDPETAAAVGADRLLAAGLAVAQGPWKDLGTTAWPVNQEQPVYVAAVELSPAGDRVTADVVIAARLQQPREQLVLRLLPAATALGDETELMAEVSLDGQPARAQVDRTGARLMVPLGERRPAGSAVLVRVELSYRLVPAETIADDGSPAAFGLLAAHPRSSTLGHWLPLLTLPSDGGPMVGWGDVGASPTAVWSLRVVHDGTLVTGGDERPCPDEESRRTCTWSRGIALRDNSAVLFATAPVTASEEAGPHRLRALAATGGDDDVAAALSEVVAATEAFRRRFGPLAWSQLDAVAVPLGRGAAGMEFPGLVMVDKDQWRELEGGFGTAVIAHEIAHQWFHALVGNGSLSNPVVDESLAQYLTVLYWRDAFGQDAAARWVEGSLRSRYRQAQDRGSDEPPAQPSGEFADGATYSAMIYARAPLAWVEADEELGAAAVVSFLRELVDRHGLAVVTDEAVIAEATAFAPALGDILQRYWKNPAPVS